MSQNKSDAPPLFKNDDGKARYMAAYDAVLRDWPVPYEELDLATGFGTTHVIASGPPNAPVVVMLPSLAASATMWRPNASTLSQQYRVYAVDVMGQVGKSVPSRRILNRQDCADWLVELFDALEVRQASVVGSSYGGFLALNLALLRSERVERLVLISPAGTFAKLPWKFYIAMIRGLVLRLLRPNRKPNVDDLLGKDAGLDPEDASWRRLMSVTLSVSVRPNTITPIVFEPTELKAVRTPTLLLIGENERLYDPSTTLTLAMERMPSVEGGIVPNAGHLAAMAQADDVNGRIIRFLKPVA